MAKKADLLEKANQLGLKLTTRNTIAEIEAAISGAETPSSQPVATVAKAGKHSQKALDEAEAKAEKEARKQAADSPSQDTESNAPELKKGPAPKTRTKLERRGKNYRKLAEKVDQTKVYTLAEAVKLATETSPSKFDASVEIHVRLGVDPRQADQNIRSTVVLPNGTGKTIRVAVFAPEEDAKKALKAGADMAGDDTITQMLTKGNLDFDVLIATPAYMAKLGKFARTLGPKGLMPNPKSGTVSSDVTKAVTEAKAGRVEYRVDKQAIIHLSVGKVSFGADKLLANSQSFFASLQAQKPASLKGVFVQSISISTTMGPGIKVEPKL